MSRCYIAYIPGRGKTKDMRVVKIGHSAYPALRFQELCAMGWLSPGWMEATTFNPVVSGSEMKRFMHSRLERDRIHHEWFHVHVEDLTNAKQALEVRYDVSWEFDDVSELEWSPESGVA